MQNLRSRRFRPCKFWYFGVHLHTIKGHCLNRKYYLYIIFIYINKQNKTNNEKVFLFDEPLPLHVHGC